MTAIVTRGDAGSLLLPDESVDLIVTSPPYFALRSYTDGGEHYEGQIGDEATPAEYLDALLACTAEWLRVLKPGGSIFVNLGDKYAERTGPPRAGGRDDDDLIRRPAHRPARGRRDVRPKSLMLLPQRYAVRCLDELGVIARQEIVWSKPNGMPESVTDRTRRSHEQVWHLVKSPRYFAAVDEIREPHARSWKAGQNGAGARVGVSRIMAGLQQSAPHAAGALPGSVWSIATVPLVAPAKLGVDHFAAFPPELVHRIVTGWSPREVCTECGQGRRPVVDRDRIPDRPGRVQGRTVDALLGAHGADTRAGSRYTAAVTITGYACGCPDTSAPTTRAVVLDPFGGTGTTALVASVLGRVGISVDLSLDYCRLARWRTTDPGERARVIGAPRPEPIPEAQGDLFDGLLL